MKNRCILHGHVFVMILPIVLFCCRRWSQRYVLLAKNDERTVNWISRHALFEHHDGLGWSRDELGLDGVSVYLFIPSVLSNIQIIN